MNLSFSNIAAMTFALGGVVFAIGELSASTFQVLSLATTIIIAIIGGYVTISVAKLGTQMKQNTDLTVRAAEAVAQTAQVAVKTSETTAKTQVVLESVQANTDGIKTKLDMKISEQEREIVSLKQRLTDQDKIAALAAVQHTPILVQAATPVLPEKDPSV